MDPENPRSDFTSVVDSVMSLFGEVMDRDVAGAIVEHCGWDLTEAIDIIVNMSEEASVRELSNNAPTPNHTIVSSHSNVAGNVTVSKPPETESVSVTRNPQNADMPVLSYSRASQSKEEALEQRLKQSPINPQISIWTPQTKQIVEYHNEGNRILILMRGLPGSGKSFLAQQLVETMCPGMNYESFIFSTHDFFMRTGRCEHQWDMLLDAHKWNQKRVQEAIGCGLSPIFVDNNNLQIRDMRSYVSAGVRGGYIIEVLEPNTPWAKKVGQLTRKNSHHVKYPALKRLMDSFQYCPSGAFLMETLRLSYPEDKVPPVMRNTPLVFEQDQNDAPSSQQTRQSQAAPTQENFLPSTQAFSLNRFFPIASRCNDYSMLLKTPNVEVTLATSGTSVEFGDTDVNNKTVKVLIATPRDINYYYTGLHLEEIPKKRMMDKSSMTNDHDHIAIETARCKNEEKHFIAFSKLFKNISKLELRDIFEKCEGDVNWAGDIVLDAIANNQFPTTTRDISDTENFDDEQCDCLAAYNIIPNVNTQPKGTIPIPGLSPTELPTGIPGPSTSKLNAEKLAKAGQEPAVPDLKEIMDMELALSIYEKEIKAEWRNNVPNDLAARMTREKLYNLFPDMNPEILSELLVAHDNNFQATVEVLLSTTGNGKVLAEENGVEKFITTKELERHEKLIEEQKNKAMSEAEWPMPSKDDKVDMNTVQEYRDKATEHMKQWDMNRLRAGSYLARNMPQVARFYSEVAVLHKEKFDHASRLAAASLIQVYPPTETTLDLHFMRVVEAKEALDLFLDAHILTLRQSQSQWPRFITLSFITGKGLHSPRGPVIKPTIKQRLRNRGIGYTVCNEGVLASRVRAEDKLTEEWQSARPPRACSAPR